MLYHNILDDLQTISPEIYHVNFVHSVDRKIVRTNVFCNRWVVAISLKRIMFFESFIKYLILYYSLTLHGRTSCCFNFDFYPSLTKAFIVCSGSTVAGFRSISWSDTLSHRISYFKNYWLAYLQTGNSRRYLPYHYIRTFFLANLEHLNFFLSNVILLIIFNIHKMRLQTSFRVQYWYVFGFPLTSSILLSGRKCIV
jgi:hypothetical protein